MTIPPTLQIGLIASPSQTSGSDRYYFDLIRALRGLGGRVDGVLLGDARDVDATATDMHAFAPEGSRALARWRGLRATVSPLVRENDVVVSHLAPHVFPVLDIIRKRPLVEHFHGPWALEGRYGGLPARTIALRLVQERSVYARAERIVALSQSFARVLRREYGVPERKIRVVPGGVDLARFAPVQTRADARRVLDLPSDVPLVVSVRRLESTKGIDRLVEAFARVLRDVPDAVLAVAGTGSLAEPLARRVREGGLERSIRFIGKIDDARLASLYRAATVSVVPSLAWEGFGLVCLESLASGTPVLVTPVGGLPEAVSGLAPELVFESCETDAIADGLRAALDGSTPLPSADACLAYAQNFAWPRIAARVAEVYREVA